MGASQAHALSVSIEAVGDPVPLLRLVSVLATRQVQISELAYHDRVGSPSRVTATIVLLNAHAGTVAAALGRVVGVTEVDLRPVDLRPVDLRPGAHPPLPDPGESGRR